jgi:hypothetical protein
MLEYAIKIPSALIYLRAGALTPENVALQQAIRDTQIKRISCFFPVFIFSSITKPSMLEISKRVWECHHLAKYLRSFDTSLHVSIGEPIQLLQSMMIKFDCSLLYSTSDDPEPAPELFEQFENTFRDFDIVSVAGIAPNSPNKIPLFWKGGRAYSMEEDEINFSLLQRFLRDPLAITRQQDLFDVASNLLHYLED